MELDRYEIPFLTIFSLSLHHLYFHNTYFVSFLFPFFGRNPYSSSSILFPLSFRHHHSSPYVCSWLGISPYPTNLSLLVPPLITGMYIVGNVSFFHSLNWGISNLNVELIMFQSHTLQVLSVYLPSHKVKFQCSLLLDHSIKVYPPHLVISFFL